VNPFFLHFSSPFSLFTQKRKKDSLLSHAFSFFSDWRMGGGEKFRRGGWPIGVAAPPRRT